mmetsp:Transcript_18116/g.28424  ORF Transcript_18116/g.28424 Transcript_18116/m.28424 type:complete len:254 (-) Transcript_18116:166-927(-)
MSIMNQDDSNWREYNIHSSADDADDQPFDIFASSTDDDDAYETIKYDIDDNVTIIIRSEKDYDKSTGMSVWTGSEVMYTYLRRHLDAVKNKKVLEIGAGCGLCGLVCRMALNAASVLITDGDHQVMKNIRYNAEELNGLKLADDATISCPQLIWGKSHAIKFAEQYGKQDVIVATDCLYITKSIHPLFETASELLEKTGVFLFINSYPWVCPTEKVIDIATEFGFVSSVDELWYHDDDKEKRKNPVHVFRRRK